MNSQALSGVPVFKAGALPLCDSSRFYLQSTESATILLSMDSQSTKDIIANLQSINNSILLGYPRLSEEEIRKDYCNLSDEEYETKSKNKTLCQGAALFLLERLRELGIDCTYIFLYVDPIIIDRVKGYGFNKRYADAIAKEDYKEVDRLCDEIIISYPDRYSVERYTHAVIEVLIGNDKYIISPTTGLFYCVGKEELLRGNGIYESYKFCNQIDFIRNNIHINKRTLLLASPIMWKRVYHISYALQGGLPVVVPPNIETYPTQYLIM